MTEANIAKALTAIQGRDTVEIASYTQNRIEASSQDILLLHDATELDYTTRSSLVDDLGQIGKGSRRGYLCHEVLALEVDSGDVLGLMDQLLHHRDEVPENETLTEHRSPGVGGRNVERLVAEMELLGRILAKTARRNKRKQPSTFELLLDPSLLGYNS